ncbi:prolyl oligopeptidase family serine peptidase [uncultured Pseudoteredinibacter sp.]|uniref:prolyl oligopeptidase family serine peptidase n=1 Tax=uncultured Pseudoteredinibacter sp. TaxID=1641701 RepID=UPI00260CF81E|nr:prolyl oligopeptidase family serine peptidase [uncultured Pseudoteredinibacter sp.]
MKNLLITFLLLLSLSTISTIAAAGVIPYQDILRNFDTQKATLSPNGKYIAIFKHADDRTLIELVLTENMSKHEIISFSFKKTARLLSLEWLDKETILIDYRHKSNNIRLQAILPIKLKEDGTPYTKAKRIWAKGRIVDNLVNRPGVVLFSINTGSETEPNQKLYYASFESLMKNKVKETGKIFHRQPKSSFFVFSSDSDKELLSTSINRGSKTVDVHYLLEGMRKWQLATTFKLEDFKFNPIGLIDKNTLAVLSNENSDLVGLYKYDLKSRSLGDLIYSHPKYDLTQATLNPTSKKLESVSYIDHGQLVNKYFSNSNIRLKKDLDETFKGQQIAITDSDQNQRKLLLLVFSSDNPGQYFLYDRKTSDLRLVADFFDNIDRDSFTRSEIFSITNEQGQQIESILTHPEDSNGVLIVNPHGGPIGVRDNDYFDRQTQFLSNRGFSILQVNFRGSWGYGKKFLESGVAQFGKAIEADISGAVKHVKEKYQFNNFCAMGTSYGGYSSVMLAIKDPNQYDCIVAAFGVYDLPLIFNSRNLDEIDGTAEGFEKILGSMREELWELSPLYQAEQIKAPTLLIAGYQDEIAPIEQSNRLKMRLEQLNKPVETLFYTDSAHGHNSWFTGQHQLLYIDHFIRRTLGIPMPHKESDQVQLREEYVKIADGLDVAKIMDKRSQQALQNYQKAAKLGDARSQFNIASHYHRGEKIEKDLDAAADWYERSAQNGYHNGYLRLAHMHREKSISSASEQQAMKFYLKAEENNIGAAKVYIARGHCLGEGTNRNIDFCLSKLDELSKNNFTNGINKKKYARTVSNIISELTWKVKFDQNQMMKLKAILKTISGASIFDARVKEKESGVYLKDSKGYYSFDRSDTTISLRKGISFGSVVETRGYKSTSSDKWGTTALKAKWTHAAKHSNKEDSEAPHYFMHFSSSTIGYYLIRDTPEDKQLMPGTWTLEMETLDGKPLYKREFNFVEE